MNKKSSSVNSKEKDNKNCIYNSNNNNNKLKNNMKKINQIPLKQNLNHQMRNIIIKK